MQVYENWALGELSAGEKDEIQANYEKSLIDNLEKNQRSSGLHLYRSPSRHKRALLTLLQIPPCRRAANVHRGLADAR